MKKKTMIISIVAIIAVVAVIALMPQYKVEKEKVGGEINKLSVSYIQKGEDVTVKFALGRRTTVVIAKDKKSYTVYMSEYNELYELDDEYSAEKEILEHHIDFAKDEVLGVYSME